MLRSTKGVSESKLLELDQSWKEQLLLANGRMLECDMANRALSKQVFLRAMTFEAIKTRLFAMAGLMTLQASCSASV